MHRRNLNVIIRSFSERTLMKTNQFIISALLAALALTVSGCVVAAVGAGAAAGVGYIRGDLEATLENDVEEVYEASLQALGQLKLAVVSKQQDALGAKIVSRNIEDKKIQINLKQNEGGITKLTIRIGIFGDEAQSRLIYDKIRDNL
jgi:hypothetical protein